MKSQLYYLLLISVTLFSGCRDNHNNEEPELVQAKVCLSVSNLPELYNAVTLQVSFISSSADTLYQRTFGLEGDQASHLTSTDTLSYEFDATDQDFLLLQQSQSVRALITADDCTQVVTEQSLDNISNFTSRRFSLNLADGWNILTYESSDFSHHGRIHSLQTHTVGEGIRLVFVGDGFSDRQIATGYYQRLMDKAVEMYFNVTPFAEFRELFDVWSIDAISVVEGCSLDATEDEPNNSAFKSFFGTGTIAGGDVYACVDIAAPVLGATLSHQLNSMFVVIMNSHKYAGATYLFYYNGCNTNFGEGWAFSFLPLAQDDERFCRLIHHEADGHGFAKLADEYLPRDGERSITASARATYDLYTSMGWYKNIDVTPDAAVVKWSSYISDPEYQDEGIGVYEGANIFTYGFYRPTESSIMKNNQGEFNAPSREAIWYRIQKLAYGIDKAYDMADFRAWDKENRRGGVMQAPYRLKKQEAQEVDPELPAPKVQELSLFER